MQSEAPDILAALWAVLAKVAPGVAGSILALRWVPEGATRWDRVWTVVGGVLFAVYVGPFLSEAFELSEGLQSGLLFVVGLFGMTVAGQITVAIKEVGLAAIVAAWVKRILGVS